MEIARSSQGILMCQHKHCLDLLQDSDLLGAKSASKTMVPTIDLHVDATNILPYPMRFCRLISELIYLTHTRPNICFMCVG